jgi:hypothetical protein
MAVNRVTESTGRVQCPVAPKVEGPAASALDNPFGSLPGKITISIEFNLFLVGGVIGLGCGAHRVPPSVPTYVSLVVSLSIQAPKGPRVIFLITPSSSPLSIQIPPQLWQPSKTKPWKV